MTLSFLSLSALEAYKLGFQIHETDKSRTIKRKVDKGALSLRARTVFSLTLKSEHNPPRPIPAGDLFIWFENEHKMLVNQVVELCQHHRSGADFPCIMSAVNDDLKPVVYKKRHFGYRWSFTGKDGSSTSTACVFKCPTSDYSRSKVNTGYKMLVAYAGGFKKSLVLPDFHNLAVKATIRPSRPPTEVRRTATDQNLEQAMAKTEMECLRLMEPEVAQQEPPLPTPAFDKCRDEIRKIFSKAAAEIALVEDKTLHLFDLSCGHRSRSGKYTQPNRLI